MSHGASTTKTPRLRRAYNIWRGMRVRCSNPNRPAFRNYGGRSIRVARRWDNFENFLADMGLPPTPAHTIERLKNDLGYNPRNCCWGTRKEQNNNTRANRRWQFRGRSRTLAQIAESLGMNYFTLYSRLVKYGWSFKRATEEPVAFSNGVIA